MVRTFTLIFLFSAVEGIKLLHLITTPKNWSDAQAYCRLHFIDFYYIDSQATQDNLQKIFATTSLVGWIGLHRDKNNTWKWSGGEKVTYFNWDLGQPDNKGGLENAVQLWKTGKWNDAQDSVFLPFYCLNIPIMAKLTWEQAQEYCTVDKSRLPNLRFDNDIYQAQKVIQLDSVPGPIWIGLRRLNDVWLWMSGDSGLNTAWPIEDQLCPTKKRCGVLTKTEGWTTWDCQDTLNFICV